MDKVALVTGGAVRVGRAIVDALADAGYRVWVHHYESTPPAVGGAIVGTVAADLTCADGRRAVTDTVLAPDGPASGTLDVLVNNAASFERGAFADRGEDDLKRVLELNLVAPLALTRACASVLRGRKGCVVNILDLGGIHPWPGYLDHCVSKAGLHMATRALAVELAPVRVVGVAPGTVAWPTSVREDADARRRVEERIPAGRIGAPGDVASAVVFLCGAQHVTGEVLAVDGGRLAGVAGPHA